MTALQAQACKLIEMLPEEELIGIIGLLKKKVKPMQRSARTDTGASDDLKRRREAYEDLQRVRAEIQKYDIVDWEMELASALDEKYGKV